MPSPKRIITTLIAGLVAALTMLTLGPGAGPANADAITAYLQRTYNTNSPCSFSGGKLLGSGFTVRDPALWQARVRTTVTTDAAGYFRTERTTYNGVTRFNIYGRCVSGRLVQDHIPTSYANRTYTKVTWAHSGGSVSAPWWSAWSAGRVY